MYKPILLTTLFGIAIGLFTGILDSFFHFIGFEEYKIINILIFALFFIGIYRSIVYLRDQLLNGFLSYWGGLKSIIYLGAIASFTIASIRYVYLKYVIKLNIEPILEKTEKTMLDHYSFYREELIDNRLSFIEFSYDPIISSSLYFFYYISFVVIFAIIASFYIRRIDRNISLAENNS